jgi:hypothetical protein
MTYANDASADFFAQAQAQQPVKFATKEDEEEDKVPRDRWQRPLIRQADGKMLPYSRASSFASPLEDKSNIAKWQAQQTVRGIAMQPDLLNAVPAEASGDPWAELSKSTKRALTTIAERAQDIAGSNLKSALGTQIHAATEFVDLGDSLEDKFGDVEPWRRELLIERANAYHRAVQDWGLKWDSVETFIVQDDVKAAGTYDRRGFVPWWPKHRQVIGDVKTSSSLDFAGVTFAVQLSVYAHGEVYDIAHETRTPHEDMDHEHALIIHVDRAKGGPVTLAKVDIAFGWSKALLARQILDARSEGRQGKVTELDEREVAIMTASSRSDLLGLADESKTWPKWLRDLANERWKELGA